MKKEKKYYTYCVNVMCYDSEEDNWKLWYIARFESVAMYRVWLAGFRAANGDMYAPKIGNIYIKYRSYKPENR